MRLQIKYDIYKKNLEFSNLQGLFGHKTQITNLSSFSHVKYFS